MSDRDIYCEREVILSDNEIKEIIQTTQKEKQSNYKDVTLSLYNRNKNTKPNFSRAINRTMEKQRIQNIELQRQERIIKIKKRLFNVLFFFRNFNNKRP